MPKAATTAPKADAPAPKADAPAPKADAPAPKADAPVPNADCDTPEESEYETDEEASPDPVLNTIQNTQEDEAVETEPESESDTQEESSAQDESEEEVEVATEPEPESENEVYEIQIAGKPFYTTNEVNGIIYSIDDNEDVGPEVGKFKNGKAVFNKK